jgi:AraC family transcriptional regulator
MHTLAEEIRDGDVDRLLADSLIAALVMRVAQRFGAPVPASLPDLPRRRLRRVLDYIEASLERDLTLAELAGVACLSPSHFSRAFKQAVGTGPHRYTVHRRVERAKDLLRNPENTLAGIAAATGFADQSHFTAAFRREVGLTPGRFRAAAGRTAIPQ